MQAPQGPKDMLIQVWTSLAGATRAGLNEALALTKAIHAAQKIEGLWLAQHPFVHAVREGLARREDLGRWVRQIYCTTKSYGEVLASLSPPPPVGVWLDPWRDLDLLLELGAALGISRSEMAASEPNLVARGLQLWFRDRLTTPSRHIAAQTCWAAGGGDESRSRRLSGRRGRQALRMQRKAGRLFQNRNEIPAGRRQICGKPPDAGSRRRTGPRFEPKRCWLAGQ